MLWRILSLSVALVAACLIVLNEAIGERADFQQHRPLIAIALGVVGVLLLAVGKWRALRRAAAAGEQPPAEGANAAVSPTAFLRSPQYWGPMLMIVAAMTYFASPPNLGAISFMKISNLNLPSVPSFSAPGKAPVKESETNPAPVVVEFPPMKMQGVVTSSRRPSAIINAKIYFIGDQVGAAVVTAIDQKSVTLELGGQTKVLTLRN